MLVFKIIYVICIFLPKIEGAAFIRMCSLHSSRVRGLEYDEERERYILSNRNPNNHGNTNSNNGTRLLLRGADVIPALITDAESPRSLQVEDVIYVRDCNCAFNSFTEYYCPVEKDTCGVLRDGSVRCFTTNSRTVLIRNAWPVIILWYGALCLFLLFTEQGRNARHFVYSKCCNRQFNDLLADRLMNPRRGTLSRRMRWLGLRRRQPSAEDNSPQIEVRELPAPRPNQLALKTKRYEREHTTTNGENEDSEDYDDQCTICFGQLEVGDRVGALSCNVSDKMGAV